MLDGVVERLAVNDPVECLGCSDEKLKTTLSVIHIVQLRIDMGERPHWVIGSVRS